MKWFEDALEYIAGLIGSGGLNYYILAILLYLGSTILWSIRWWFILKRLGSSSSLLNVYTAVMGGILVNNISPSLKMGGEGFRAAWLKIRENIPIDRSLLTIMYERLTEAPGVIMVGLIAIKGGLIHPLKTSVTKVIGLGLGVLGSKNWKSLRIFIKDIWYRVKSDSGLLLKDKLLSLVSSGIAVIIWLQDIARFYLIGLSIGIHLSIPEAAVLSLGYLIFGLGPTPAGIGFVEGGLASLLVAMGFPLDKAGLLVLGERLISSVLSSLLGLFLVILTGGIEGFRRAFKLSKERE